MTWSVNYRFTDVAVIRKDHVVCSDNYGHDTGEENAGCHQKGALCYGVVADHGELVLGR